MHTRVALLMLLLGSAVAIAQPPAPPPSTLNVYLDCQDTFCDFDYFRTELAVVNWVRDRAVSDIHVLVTSQRTGSGGREYTVTFIGLRQFAGITDTLKYVSPPASTDDEVRKGLAGIFKLGFVRYFARTPAGSKVEVRFPKSSDSAQTTTKKDPWKAWVFRTGIDGFTYGEETYKELNTSGRLEADRITERWKTRISLREYRYRSRQTYPTCDASNVCRDTTVKVKRESFERSLLQVRSLGQHLSAGLRVSNFGSIYDNHKRVIHAFPAIEYNFFPYKESTRRQLRIEYNLGYGNYVYNDTTVFDRIREGMSIQKVTLGVAAREKWGSVNVEGEAIQYLGEAGRYRMGAYTDFNVRVFKGFELNAFGRYDKIRDQFNLAKKNYTPQEILTRQFQQGTGYRFFSGFGVSYTFGSIFNNVVNPRMGR